MADVTRRVLVCKIVLLALAARPSARATIGYLVYKEGTSTTMLRTAETLSTQGPVLIPTLSKVPGPMRKGQLDSGRRTKESLAMDLTFHMWMRKHGLTQIIDYSCPKHLPHLLNYRRFYGACNFRMFYVCYPILMLLGKS